MMKKLFVWLFGIAMFVLAVKYVGFSQAGNCSALAAGIQAELREYTSCQADEECAFVRLNCPFDCFTPVRRDRVDRAMNAASPYGRSCLMVCPECPKTLPRGAHCQSGRCVVGARV
ncbi:MAG: hypothetical protein EBZ48_01975 [Proteobacteria bacterium]|nr:hypothetical protein [Pseudomonadota bacterium]